MDHFKVLKRAWEITWRYRALWVFGIILALTTSRGGRGGGNNGVQYTFGSEDFPFRGGKFSIPEISRPQISSEVTGTLIAIGVGLACLVLLLIVVTVVARYVARTALIRMVDDHEETGEKRGVRQGFRMGWSRAAWRLFLIDLVVGVPLVLAFILLFLLALAPLLLWTTGSRPAGVVGTVATIGLFFLFLFLLIVVALVVTLLMHFFRRACALDGLGVIESIRHGFDVVREHLKDVAIMWLIMIGVSIGLALVMIFVVLLLVAFGVLLGGLPALVVGGLASQAFQGAVPWILAAAVGVPIFLLVVVVPMLFLGGLVEVFKSSVWTLTYRELRALEAMEPEPSVA
jgi:hypothetical protein